jgi:hypothetical protein
MSLIPNELHDNHDYFLIAFLLSLVGFEYISRGIEFEFYAIPDAVGNNQNN